MNFADFQIRRAALLRERPELHDCAETNLYRALAPLAVPLAPPPEATIHRCHLAETWTGQFGLPPEFARRALISGGVRDSLARLFRHYAGQAARAWLPADNYPVFAELACAAGLRPETFPTLGELRLPDAAPADGVEILLLTNPLKPAGRWLTDEEVARLRSWLAASPRRRLLLDTVYTFGDRFHPTTSALLETGQITLLHSLTKGWLSPRLFGIALVPETDFVTLSPGFRDAPPPQAGLAQARELMQHHAGLPGRIAVQLAEAETRLRAILPLASNTALAAPARYLFPVEQPWENLLTSHGVLGLPASAFGAANDRFTIVGSLKFIP